LKNQGNQLSLTVSIGFFENSFDLVASGVDGDAELFRGAFERRPAGKQGG
jgi:hypothetical protein